MAQKKRIHTIGSIAVALKVSLALVCVHLCENLALAATEKDLLTTATNIAAGTSYVGGGTPLTNWDVTWTNGTYSATTFLLNSNLSIGTLNDLNASQALTLTNNGKADTTLTLNGGTDAVSGSAAGDLIYVAANGRLTIQNGTRNLNLALATSGNFNTGAGASLTIASVISGNANITKTGAGTLTLSAANTFIGAVAINGGVVAIQNAGAFGTAANTASMTVASGATLQISNNITTTNAGTLVLNGTGAGAGALQSVSGSNAWNSNVTIASNATIGSSTAGTRLTIGNATPSSFFAIGKNIVTFDGAGDTWLNSNVGVAGDTGSVIKNGTGRLIFYGYDTNYTGSTTVNAGSLELVVGPFSGTSLRGINGSLTIGTGSANSALAGTVNVNIWNSSFDNQISSSSAVTINSDGALNLGATPMTGGAGTTGSTTLGTLTLNGGQVTMTSALSITPSGGITTNVNSAHQTAQITGGTVNIGAPTIFTVARDTTITSDLTVASIVAGGALTKQGAGVMTFTGANTFTGGVAVNSGTIVAGNNSAFGPLAAQMITFNGGKLASDNAARSLANNLIVNPAAGNGITGANSLTLTGGASANGELDINFSNAAAVLTVNPTTANSFAPGLIRLTSGTLLLGGSDKIGNNTALALAGGKLNTGGFSDQLGALSIQASSTIDFGATNNVHLQFSSAAWGGGTLNIANWTGAASSANNADQLLFAGPVSIDVLNHIAFAGYGSGAIAFDRGNGMYEVSPVPEPATVFGALGLVGFVACRERRRIARVAGMAFRR